MHIAEYATVRLSMHEIAVYNLGWVGGSISDSVSS